MKKELIEKLIGTDVKDIAHWEEKYPSRNGQVVTRVAPSPTGFMHIGGIFQSVINRTFAHQNKGIFMLRIEDTDTKREVEGATDLIINSLKLFNLEPDEGPLDEKGGEKGAYGPYLQSKRGDIYRSGVKTLLEKGLAYPCFATEEELETIRKEQTALKLRPGYYGKWARYRNLTDEQIEENLAKGMPFIFRFKASGDGEARRYFEDIVKGKVQMPENDMDIVIMKSDGLPTYHFAHLIDDHFMRTTHVIRADEWLASLPLHVQLFESMGWTVPNYAHTAAIQKLDEGNRRKLSKRKDKEADVAFYFETGYPIEAVKEYSMNLANSGFEDFKKNNPVNALENFELKLENLNVSGALLDFNKLDNIAKEIIATWSSTELYNRLHAWASTYDQVLLKRLDDNKDYIKKILGIERDGVEKVRKDFYAFSKIWDEISYFFDDSFHFCHAELVSASPLKESDVKILVDELVKTYNHNATKDEWFDNIKDIAFRNGYAKNPKEAAKEPEKYKGSVSDVATIYRLLITGRPQSPDLYAIKQILGADRVIARLKA